MRRFALAVTCVVSLACVSALPAWAEPQASIAQGALSGTSEGTISEFKGIPFAAPPVGALRWRAPQPASGWQGTRDAQQRARRKTAGHGVDLRRLVRQRRFRVSHL